MSDVNEKVADILQRAFEDNDRIGDMAWELYERGFKDGRKSVPKGLPGVTEQQVAAELMRYEPIGQDSRVIERLTEWFNDPDRDVPAEPTMHPDLEWLAQLPPERFERIPRRKGEERTPYFYRHRSLEGHYGDRLGWGFDPAKAPSGVETFTFAEVRQARNHLAGQKVNQMNGPWKQEFDAAGARERAARNYAQGSILNLLANLPDYETWFKRHGNSTTAQEGDGSLQQYAKAQPATVHELYTMFRARLLAELHQAGVIGGDHE